MQTSLHRLLTAVPFRPAPTDGSGGLMVHDGRGPQSQGFCPPFGFLTSLHSSFLLAVLLGASLSGGAEYSSTLRQKFS